MEAEKPLPGVTTDELHAAAEALKELHGAGKFLFFYSYRNALRLVGNPKDFRDAFEAKAPGETGDEELGDRALRELRQFMRILVETPDREKALSALKAYVYDDELAKLEKPDQIRFEKMLREKVEYVDEQLVQDSLRERYRRLRSAVGPSFEELDVEIVNQRQDQLCEEDVDTPFLRLRLRYSEATTQSLPFFFGPPWIGGSALGGATPGFEIECDETDIDLMLLRLRDAKKRLREAIRSQVKK